MAYCTLADITKRIPETTLVNLTDDQDLGVIDEAVVSGIIADADELIDGFLRGRYELPLADIPGLVKSLSVDLVAYSIYGRRAEFEIPKAVSDKHAATLKILQSIQKGEVRLGVAGVEAPAPAVPANSVQVVTSDRIFTRDSMKGL